MNELSTSFYEAKAPGKHLLILGAIHGDETCGTYALARLKFELDARITYLEAGKLTIVPVCNPAAYVAGKRYIESNLNRIITPWNAPPSIEHRYANEITKLIDASDIVLDLHSYTSGSLPFIFLDHPTPENNELAKAVGIKHCVLGWPDLYEEAAASDGDTVTYANKKGKSGIVVECGTHTDPSSIITGDLCIRRILSSLNMLPSFQPSASVEMEFYRAEKIFFRDSVGTFAKEWQHLDPVQAGETLINYADATSLRAPYSGVVLLPDAKAQPHQEWIYFGRKVAPPRIKASQLKI